MSTCGQKQTQMVALLLINFLDNPIRIDSSDVWCKQWVVNDCISAIVGRKDSSYESGSIVNTKRKCICSWFTRVLCQCDLDCKHISVLTEKWAQLRLPIKGHLIRMPPWPLPLEVFWACPTRRRPWDRPRADWRGYVCIMRGLGTSQDPPQRAGQCGSACCHCGPDRKWLDRRRT